MRIILIDDEPFALEEIKEILDKNGKIEVVGTYTEPLKSFQEVSVTNPDWAFLDIEMAGMSEIELVEKLLAINSTIEVLFITTHNYYSSQAFDVNAIDYILEPLRTERINKAVDKLLKNSNVRYGSHDTSCKIRFFGGFEVIVGNNPIRWNRSKTKELLSYLLQYEGQWLDKYKLCDELWPKYEPDKALAYLHTTIWALRKNLKEAGCTQIKLEFACDKYILRLGDVNWDLREFERYYKMFIQSGSLESAKMTVQCYRGEYLEGEDWPWADITRESYTLRYNELPKGTKFVSGRKRTKLR